MKFTRALKHIKIYKFTLTKSRSSGQGFGHNDTFIFAFSVLCIKNSILFHLHIYYLWNKKFSNQMQDNKRYK